MKTKEQDCLTKKHLCLALILQVGLWELLDIIQVGCMKVEGHM